MSSANKSGMKIVKEHMIYFNVNEGQSLYLQQ